MPAKNQKKRRTRVTPTRTSEVLDVKMAAELLTVSPDTIYDLFKRGELPGRKVESLYAYTFTTLKVCVNSKLMAHRKTLLDAGQKAKRLRGRLSSLNHRLTR